MADDLKRFIFEERNNFRRYKSNIDAIIQKYDRHFTNDAEIDLATLKSYNVRDEKVVKKLRPKPFGHTKLLSTKKKELSESLYNGSCINRDESVFSDGNFTMQETTIHDNPSTKCSPESDKTYVKDNLSLYQDQDSVIEGDPDLLALKTSYFEIISEKNDEPSDAETLSSYSSDESDRLLDEDDSEDGDDEDSQADDKIPAPFPRLYDNCDSTSLSSTEDHMDVVNLEFTKPKKKYSPCTTKNLNKHKRIQDIQLKINCLQTELENVKKEETKTGKKIKPYLDEVDGDFPSKCPDVSGYSGKERLSTIPNKTERIVGKKAPFHLDFGTGVQAKQIINSIPGNKKKVEGKFDDSYLQNKRIEKWVEDINMETGINEVHYDNYITECKDGKSDIKQQKQDIGHVKTMFASPDRFLRKMKENKVGVAVKMFSNVAKEDKICEEVQKGKVHLRMNKTFVKEIKTCTDGRQLPATISKTEVCEDEDIFIVEDDFENDRKPERRQLNRNLKASQVTQSVPAVKFLGKRNNTNKEVLKEMNTNSTMDRLSELNTVGNYGNRITTFFSRNEFTKKQQQNPTVKNLDSVELRMHSTFEETSSKADSVSEANCNSSAMLKFGQKQNKSMDFEDSDLHHDIKYFKKRSERKRKFIPPENTANLIKLMLQPETEVAQFLSPRAFHKKFDKHIHTETKPVFETLKCLSSERSTPKVKGHSGLFNIDSYKSQVVGNMGKFQGQTHDNLESAIIKKSVGPIWSPPVHKDLKIQQDKLSSYGKRCSTQNMSLYRSAKDLSNIEQYANSSFCSPGMQNGGKTVIDQQDISKSVPAKLQGFTQNSLTRYNKCEDISSSPFENKIKTYSRTKLRAKRSLQLIENDNSSGLCESVERPCVDNKARYYSKDVHTPSKKDHYDFSTNEESPSTVLSRLLLNTPSPGGRKSTEKFRRFKSNLEQMTQPQNTISKSANGDGVFKKPVANNEESKSIQESDHLFSKPARTNLVIRYSCDHSSQKNLYTPNFDRRLVNLPKSKREWKTSNECFIKPENVDYKTRNSESRWKTSNENFIKPENVDSKTRNSESRWKTSNEHFFIKPTNTETHADYSKANTDYYNNVFTANTDQNRKKALFQSTPMKSSEMFQLNNTMSTIYSADLDDDSDCEVMTISNSP